MWNLSETWPSSESVFDEMGFVAGFRVGVSRGERRLVRFAVVWRFDAGIPHKSSGSGDSWTGRVVADLLESTAVTLGVDTTGMAAWPPTPLADLRAAGWARYLQGWIAFPLLTAVLAGDSHCR